MAQFGRALRSGRRSRRFESCHLDQKHRNDIIVVSVFFCFRNDGLEPAAGSSECPEMRDSILGHGVGSTQILKVTARRRL